MKTTVLTVLFLAAATLAQCFHSDGVAPNPNGSEPIFRVDVTSKTVRAVNYHNRQGTKQHPFPRNGAYAGRARRSECGLRTRARRGSLSLNFDRLSNPAQFGPEYLTFVLWAITP